MKVLREARRAREEREAWLARLTPVEIIVEQQRAVAALSPARLNLPQISLLYAMLPREALMDAELAQRWGLAVVLADRDWGQAQRRREPMLKPKGEKVCFL